MDGIWGKVEFLTLKRSDNDGKVCTIEADRKNAKLLWSPFLDPQRSPFCGTDDGTAAVFDEGELRG